MKPSQDSTPPRWALRFLRWFCKPELLEYIEGDLRETFDDNLGKYSFRKAKRKYSKEVLGMFRPGIIRNFHITSIHPIPNVMFFNYLKVGFRQIRRHALFSFLNIFGLAMSMAICLLVIMIIVDQFSYDKFHKKADRIFRVISVRGGEQTAVEDLKRFNATSPIPIAEELRDNYTGIESLARIHRVYGTDMRSPNKTLSSHGLYVDQSFFTIFDFGKIQGNAFTALQEPFSLFLTQSLAKKLFGEKNPVGQWVRMGSSEEDFIVKGIIEDPPRRSHMKFEFLASFSSIESRAPENLSDWGYIWGYYVYLLLDAPEAEQKLNLALEEISTRRSAYDPYYSYKFEAQALNDINPRDGRVSGNEMGNTLPYFVFYFLSSLGLIIILSACFNYTNLSIARSLKRAKEIGIRKVVGGRRRQLLNQFIIESVLVSIFALLLAIVLLEFLIPRFYRLDPHVSGIFYLQRTPQVYFLFLLFSIGVGVIAGLIPALHLSKYRPIQVLKNLSQVKIFSFGGLQKGLLVFQFVLSLIFATSTLFLAKQYKLLLHTDHGFSFDDILNVNLHGNSYDIFAQAAQQLKEVEAVSGSQLKMATGTAHSLNTYIPNSTDSLSLHANFVSSNFLQNLKLTLLAGSELPEQALTRGEQYIVLNEKAVEKLGLGAPQEAIGQPLQVSVSSDSSSYLTVIGVVKDFYDMDITSPVYPYGFRQGKAHFQFANIRFHPGETQAGLAKLNELWREIDPHHTFTYDYYQDEVADRYGFIQAGSKVVGLIGVLAIVIVLLGLLGMVTYMVEGHIKEIGIRKILGANAKQLVWRLSKGFLILLGIATIISIPLSALINNLWLESFAFRVPIDVSVFLIGVGGVLLLSAVIIISQTLGAAKGNPVEALRSE